MLSSTAQRCGSIQLVDFGCAEVEGEDDDDDDHLDLDDIFSRKRGAKGSNKHVGQGGFTPAYSSPEAFEDRNAAPLPPSDMWALGVIVYIVSFCTAHMHLHSTGQILSLHIWYMDGTVRC